MNDPTTPTPNLEHTAQPASPEAPPSNAQISHGINPPSSTQPVVNVTPETALPEERRVSKTILIVEDERFISDLYTRALEKAGYTVSVAGDGEEALSIANTGNFDLVLLDIMLPTMNGVDLLYKLKDPNNQLTAKTKVIITTNMDQKAETKTKVEQMADGYLIKAEVTPRELVDYVGQVFGTS